MLGTLPRLGFVCLGGLAGLLQGDVKGLRARKVSEVRAAVGHNGASEHAKPWQRLGGAI